MTKVEKLAKEKFEQDGWTVYTSGWPDFLLVRGNEVKTAEVKSKGDKIRSSQEKILDVLVRYIPTTIVLEGPGFGDNEGEVAVLVYPKNEDEKGIWKRGGYFAKTSN